MEFKTEQIDKAMTQMLSDMADAMIRYMESDTRIPIDTHNLKDGLGVAVFINGVLTKFKMTPKAEKPRRNIGTIRGETYPSELWGKDAIDKVMNDGIQKYGQGYKLVLYSSMPYDVIQDEREANRGWFSVELSNQFKDIVMEILNIYGGKV